MSHWESINQVPKGQAILYPISEKIRTKNIYHTEHSQWKYLSYGECLSQKLLEMSITETFLLEMSINDNIPPEIFNFHTCALS